MEAAEIKLASLEGANRVSPNSKVLHFALNPEVNARAKQSFDSLEKLKAENKILQERLAQVSNQAVDSAAVADMKEKIAEGEKRILRLKEVFQQKIGGTQT